MKPMNSDAQTHLHPYIYTHTPAIHTHTHVSIHTLHLYLCIFLVYITVLLHLPKSRQTVINLDGQMTTYGRYYYLGVLMYLRKIKIDNILHLSLTHMSADMLFQDGPGTRHAVLTTTAWVDERLSSTPLGRRHDHLCRQIATSGRRPLSWSSPDQSTTCVLQMPVRMRSLAEAPSGSQG